MMKLLHEFMFDARNAEDVALSQEMVNNITIILLLKASDNVVSEE